MTGTRPLPFLKSMFSDAMQQVPCEIV